MRVRLKQSSNFTSTVTLTRSIGLIHKAFNKTFDANNKTYFSGTKIKLSSLIISMLMNIIQKGGRQGKPHACKPLYDV